MALHKAGPATIEIEILRNLTSYFHLFVHLKYSYPFQPVCMFLRRELLCYASRRGAILKYFQIRKQLFQKATLFANQWSQKNSLPVCVRGFLCLFRIPAPPFPVFFFGFEKYFGIVLYQLLQWVDLSFKLNL